MQFPIIDAILSQTPKSSHRILDATKKNLIPIVRSVTGRSVYALRGFYHWMMFKVCKHYKKADDYDGFIYN